MRLPFIKTNIDWCGTTWNVPTANNNLHGVRESGQIDYLLIINNSNNNHHHNGTSWALSNYRFNALTAFKRHIRCAQSHSKLMWRFESIDLLRWRSIRNEFGIMDGRSIWIHHSPGAEFHIEFNQCMTYRLISIDKSRKLLMHITSKSSTYWMQVEMANFIMISSGCEC